MSELTGNCVSELRGDLCERVDRELFQLVHSKCV